jgi:hypothetical protein
MGSRLVLTSVRVEALVLQYEPLNRNPAHYVRFNDLVHVGKCDATVPDCVGIDDNIGPVLTLIETSSLVGSHFSLQATFGEFAFKKFL